MPVNNSEHDGKSSSEEQGNEKQLVGIRFEDYRLVPVCAGTWVGTIGGLCLPRNISGMLIICALGISAITLLASFCDSEKIFRHQPIRIFLVSRILCVICICFTFGTIIGDAAVQRHSNDKVAEQFTDAESLKLSITLREDFREMVSKWDEVSFWAEANVDLIWGQGKWFTSEARVFLSIDEKNFYESQLKMRGDQAVVFGVPRKNFPSSSLNVGLLKIRQVEEAKTTSGWRLWSNKVRSDLEKATYGLPEYARGLIGGMAVGDDHLLGDDLTEAMLTSSMTHLTAVSGSHIAIALGFFALLPVNRRIRFVAVGAFLVLLTGVVGPEPSVVRAVLSTCVISCGIILKHPSRPISALATIGIGVLIFDPWMGLSLGFALSMVSTWGILYSGRSWSNWLQEKAFHLVKVSEISDVQMSGIRKILFFYARVFFRKSLLCAVQATAISTAASIWVFPITLLMNPWVSLWGILANVLVAPAIAPLTILSLLSAACAIPWPQLAIFLANLATPFAWWINNVAVSLSHWPFARLPWIDGPLGIVVAVLFVLFLIMLGHIVGKREK